MRGNDKYAEHYFTGLCVGGPLDGKNATQRFPEFRVHTLSHSEPLMYSTSMDPDVKVEAPPTTYDYVPVTPFKAFWVHESLREAGRSLADIAIELLAEQYVKNKGKKR